MALSVRSYREDSGESVYYDADFRRMIEQHRIYLQNAQGYVDRDITPGDAWRWRFDFYGLLQSMGVPEKLRWIYLRVNDYSHPADFDSTRTTIRIPNESAIEKLVALYRNQYRVS